VRCSSSLRAWFPSDVGGVSGVVGAPGGLGGFFPPLVMAVAKSLTGSYVLGFVLLAAFAVVCLIVLESFGRAHQARESVGLGRPGPLPTHR
jgi:nitrate/nitrite transporter NarK